MAKKKRNPGATSAPNRTTARPEDASTPSDATVASGRDRDAPTRAAPRAAALTVLPPEVVRGDWTVLILALMMFLAPAAGVPNEEMLQDTLKSVIVSFAALGAGLMFFWHQRNRRDGLRWHALIWLPLALMFYALGSMTACLRWPGAFTGAQ